MQREPRESLGADVTRTKGRVSSLMTRRHNKCMKPDSPRSLSMLFVRRREKTTSEDVSDSGGPSRTQLMLPKRY